MKGKEVARIHVVKEQGLYIISDPDSPPPDSVAKAAQREIEFNDVYKQKTGVLWRHYYGSEGPRPPPEVIISFRPHLPQLSLSAFL